MICRQYRTSSLLKNVVILCIDIIGHILFFWFLATKKKQLLRKKKRLSDIKKIAVVRFDNIGDMVLTTGFLKNLKQSFPHASMTVFCRPIQKSIIKNSHYVDHIITYDAPRFGGKWTYREWIQLMKKYRWHYDLWCELHGELKSIITTYMISDFRIGFWIRGWSFLLNQSLYYNASDSSKLASIVEYQYQLLEKVWWKITNKALDLVIPHISLQWRNNNFQHKNKLIILHPGVSEQNRARPLDHRISLAKKLQSHWEYTICMIDINEQTIHKAKEQNIMAYKPDSLDEFIAIVDKTNLLVWVESLSSHVAAALQKKCVAIYSWTTPRHLMYPYGKYVTVIDALDYKETPWLVPLTTPNKHIAQISPTKVYKIVKQLLDT